jgi:hypothetical protein
MFHSDIEILLGHPVHDPEMRAFAKKLKWRRSKPLSKWKGCVFKGATLVSLSLHMQSIPDHAIAVLPETLGRCVFLKKLDVSRQRTLVALFSSIGNCVRLEHLRLRWCTSLTELPESLSQCSRLKTLNCTYCDQLRALPESLSQCSQLSALCCGYCDQLHTLPQSLAEGCAELTRLVLFNCKSLISFQLFLQTLVRKKQIVNIQILGCSSGVVQAVKHYFMCANHRFITDFNFCNDIPPRNADKKRARLHEPSE